MTGYSLQEDKLPPKLPFVLSAKIRSQIFLIDDYNQDMPDQVLQWHHYIEWMASYISNPAIAFDYANRYVHYRNGAMHISELTINATVIVKYTAKKGAYVYIFKLDLKPEDFGLKLPPFEIAEGISSQNANKVMDDTLKRIVKDELMRYNSNHILNETTEGGRVIHIDEGGFRNLIKSASLRFLSVMESKGYQPIAHNKTVTLDNGTRRKSLVTLSDGAGRYDIGEDDGCYSAQWIRSKEKGQLNEKYYNPFREPMIDGNLNGYDVLDGCEDEQILCDLPEKGWVEDIRMYSKMRAGGKTYCLYRRIDNGKYFFVEVFDDPNDDKHLHGRAVPKKKIPYFIWNDAIALIRRN